MKYQVKDENGAVVGEFESDSTGPFEVVEEPLLMNSEGGDLDPDDDPGQEGGGGTGPRQDK